MVGALRVTLTPLSVACATVVAGNCIAGTELHEAFTATALASKS